MKRKLIVIAALAALALPAVCSAAPPRPGAYVSGFLGVTVPKDSDVTGIDFLGTPPLSIDEQIEFDPGINVGGTAGYDFGIVRLEGELSYKQGEMKSVTLTTGDRVNDVDGSLGVLAMMFNGFFDLHNSTPVTPYWGGGIGFAAMHLSDTFAPDGSLIYQAGDDTVFAYQAGAGLDIALNRQLSLDLGYRYFGTAKANFATGQDIETSMKYESHNATVGFRVKF
ncbi:MAG: outer membrane beta-barrel protein [Geobacteraceae bacterium]|nr:outer membrane beta-barrel protein [Geobacteraceae bacterium]